MDIAPWMLIVYIGGALLFYTLMFVLIGPWFTKKMLLRSINSDYGRKVFAEALNNIVPILMPQIKDAVRNMFHDPGTGKFFKDLMYENLPAVKGWAAAELMKPEVQQYLADMAAGMLVSVMDSEIEVETDKGKEKIGMLSYFSSAVVSNIQMRLLGDKSVLSREIRDAGELITKSALPPEMAALAGPLMGYAKKHPWLSMLMQYAIQNGALDKFKSMQTGGGQTAALAYRGV